MMDRKEAIKILQEEIDGNLELSLREWRERDEQRLFPALRMAIEALSAEPTDLISRADAVKSLPNGTCYDSSGCVNALKNLPSAERPNIAYICDGTACDGACDECHHTTDIEHAKNFKCVGGKYIESADRPSGEWIPCSERMPETDNKNEINEYDVLLLVKDKKHQERNPQVYIGKLNHVDGDDGSGNFWGIKTKPCDWTIWGWSYFSEPDVLAWMPLPKPYCPNCGAKMGGNK